MIKWIAIFLLVNPCAVLAKPGLEFHLCSVFVQQSAVDEQTENEWPIHVKLTEIGATSFERFTDANIGRMIRVVVDDRVFLKATIWMPISDGALQGKFRSCEAAKVWQQTFAGKLPVSPCGVN